MSNLQQDLLALSRAVGAGSVRGAAETAVGLLSPYADCETTDNLTVFATVNGACNRTLLLDAHLDEVSMIVTDIDENGFLTVSACGGLDLRALPARPVTVHGRQEIPAVFCSVPPHLSDGDPSFDRIADLKIDTLLGAEAKKVIAVGDTVSFRAEPVPLSDTRITGKSLDNRASVAVLVELARRFSAEKPPMNLCFVLSAQEELGLRGIRTAAHRVQPDEAVVLDVSFADGVGISPLDCGNMGKGAMIGYSPVLERKISKKLTRLAQDHKIPYQIEVMDGHTGTNADAVSLVGNGIPTGLVSIPLRNMHTDVETVDLSDLKSVCDLIEHYIRAGGGFRD
ncbi:MAG: M20/M25/M40 family metallo-hydrolase [Clostridia bacterium]|nr:M20/M25/M40 family metallo-hydrolase [Clostridia bacterium]